ncbi:hypothetical protein BKH41_00665 [Helicobacter sp. 12S02232-10]|uniref:hypothetical protein n=1 Tax=Helicobacter sp. 12S02232-10 TaxID=1476197 RepID=UPI000BA72006|nr:hypothetical protein [Helicobacter sp. 12S02232-10]PAF49847.1 hypothetical protein BKH41_00665 [Helicobacter sp. 12S02232-10]
MFLENLDFLSLKIPKEAYTLLKTNFGRNCLILYGLIRNRCEFNGSYKFTTSEFSEFFEIEQRQINRWLNFLKQSNLIDFKITSKHYICRIEGITGKYPPYSNPVNEASNSEASESLPPVKKSKKKKEKSIYSELSDEELDLMDEIETYLRGQKLRYQDFDMDFLNVIYEEESNEFQIRFLREDGGMVYFTRHRTHLKKNNSASLFQAFDNMAMNYHHYHDTIAPKRSVGELVNNAYKPLKKEVKM